MTLRLILSWNQEALFDLRLASQFRLKTKFNRRSTQWPSTARKSKKVTFELNMKDFTLKQTTTTFTSLAFQGSFANTIFAFFSLFLNATIALVWIVFRTFIAFHWKFWTKFTVDITQSKAFSAAENHFRMRHLKKFSYNLQGWTTYDCNNFDDGDKIWLQSHLRIGPYMIAISFIKDQIWLQCRNSS